MLEGQFIRTDRDLFVDPSATDFGDRLEQLRDHFSPEEAEMFGIDRPYDDRVEARPAARPLLSGLAASMATVLLFTGVGLLGLPAGAFA